MLTHKQIIYSKELEIAEALGWDRIDKTYDFTKFNYFQILLMSYSVNMCSRTLAIQQGRLCKNRLNEMVHDKEPYIRVNLVFYCDGDFDIIEKLSYDSDIDVRKSVVEACEKKHKKILKRLTLDKEEIIRHQAQSKLGKIIKLSNMW